MFLKFNPRSAMQGLGILVFLLMTGCATMQPAQPIQAGDLVRVDYTCRFNNGEIVATTLEKVASDEGLEKSELFRVNGSGFQPVLLRAKEESEGFTSKDRDKNFQDHIASCLVGRLAGLKPGETRALELKGELIPGLRREDRYLQLMKVWRYTKQEIIARQEVEDKMGKVPEVGFEMPWRGPFTARVDEVTDNFVKFDILAPPGAVMESPFGKGLIRDGGERWEVEVDVREGRLVRSGGLLGRISEVGDDLFTVDFGYPFAGETLLCDVRAEAAEAVQDKTTSDHYNRSENQKKEMALTEPASQKISEIPQPPIKGTEKPFSNEMEGLKVDQAGSGVSQRVEAGDLVEICYTATLEDGAVIQTNIQDIWENPERKRISGYEASKVFKPVEVIAGEEAVFPGLGESVLDMVQGEKKKVPLVPDRAFGQRDPKKIQTFPTIKRIPKLAAVKANEYLQRFKTLPVIGKEVYFTPYFKSRIIDVNEEQVILKALAQDGMRVENEFGGTTEIRIEGDEVVLQLIPKLGSTFEIDKRKGVTSSFNEKTFSVDFNHPLAGKPIVLEVEVISIAKADAYAGEEISWIEDYGEGLTEAEKQEKPAVLVLYADWCGYSKKMFNETMSDLRVKMLKDAFVWVKVDSDKESGLKEHYEQKGFPLTVLLDSHGGVIEKLDGFRPAKVFREELKKALNGNDSLVSTSRSKSENS